MRNLELESRTNDNRLYVQATEDKAFLIVAVPDFLRDEDNIKILKESIEKLVPVSVRGCSSVAIRMAPYSCKD